MERLKNWLANESGQWWRLWSVRLAALAGTVSAVLTAHPTLLLGLIGFIPHGTMRLAAAAFVGLIVFAIPTIVRLWPQPKVAKKLEEQRRGE